MIIQNKWLLKHRTLKNQWLQHNIIVECITPNKQKILKEKLKGSRLNLNTTWIRKIECQLRKIGMRELTCKTLFKIRKLKK